MEHLAVPQFLGLLAVMLGAAKIGGALAQRVGQPAVLGELVAGVLLGGSVVGLVDPTTCRALTPGGGPRDDLLLIGQASAGSYFTVSALDVVAGQARRAAQTIADAITTRTSLRLSVAGKAA